MLIDIRKLFKIFNVGDVLRAFSTNPFQILKKLNCNIYVIDFGISFIFNIKVLVDDKCFDFNPSNLLISYPISLFLRDPPFFPILNILPKYSGSDYKILDEVLMTHKYLVQWCSGQDSDPHKIMTYAQTIKSFCHLGTIPEAARSEDFRSDNSDASSHLGVYHFPEPSKAPTRKLSGDYYYSATYN